MHFERRQGLAEEREDRRAIHHGRLVVEMAAMSLRQLGQLPVRVYHRAFVGADGVRSRLERCAEVADGRLTCLRVQRTRFEQDVWLGCRQPLVKTRGPFRLGVIAVEQVVRDEPFGRNQPTEAARSNAGNLVGNTVLLAQIGGFPLEQSDQASTDSAESDQAKVEAADIRGGWLIYSQWYSL